MYGRPPFFCSFFLAFIASISGLTPLSPFFGSAGQRPYFLAKPIPLLAAVDSFLICLHEDCYGCRLSLAKVSFCS
jgi:hypothetical protein